MIGPEPRNKSGHSYGEIRLRSLSEKPWTSPIGRPRNWDILVQKFSGSATSRKREKPENSVSKLGQVKVLQGQGVSRLDVT
jgi:hypothetical protein